MANKAKDVTWKLERRALAYSLERLCQSKTTHPDEAIAEALGLSGQYVKKRRYFYCLSQGYASAISGTDLGWRDIVDLLRKHEWIRPATEVVGASLWPFLRGELTPSCGVTELVEHHAARVNFTRVGMGKDLMRHLSPALAKKPEAGIIFPVPIVTNARLREIPDFLESTVAVADKLTIVGLLYVEAYLAGYLQKASHLETCIRHFSASRSFEDTFGPVAPGVRDEFRDRLFRGRLLFTYGQRCTGSNSPRPLDRFLLPTDGAEKFLGDVVDAMFAAWEQKT